ncbi:hypothetical protein GW17_00041184 [Ensete ventricosum]|nr:hypothetical protein GW17_00041184 [Ensete ventricosum]
MFDLLRMKIKSPSRTLGRLAPSPPVEAPIEGAEKRSDKGGSKPSRKKMKVIVSKLLKKAAPRWASKWAHRSKGKELAKEAAESLDYPPTVRELCEVDGWAGKDKNLVMQIFDLP